MVGTGELFPELAAILAGIGLIVGLLSLTGKVGTIAYELVPLAGENTILLLLKDAEKLLIPGSDMTVTAAYLFLGITLGPGLEQGGLNPLAGHIFIPYWAMISLITPPVAIGAYAAASVAQCNPLKCALELCDSEPSSVSCRSFSC